MLKSFAENGDHKLMMKWDHYFPIYEKYFSPYRNRPITLLEIGVYKGGSLDMWRNYFDKNSTIVGIDVFPEVLNYSTKNTHIVLCDQGNRQQLLNLATKYGPFDIILDDGGHHMNQQICSFETLFPFVSPNGLYIVEDTHTSYWEAFGGGLRNPNSFIEFAKRTVDYINVDWFREQDKLDLYVPLKEELKRSLVSTSFYDSMVVFEKGEKPERKAYHYEGNGNYKLAGSSRSE
jgi:hypothetical protein